MEASPTRWHSGVEHASLSDVGLRRNSNQDSLALSLASSDEAWQARGHLLMVADGMGAHAAGELASKMAVDIVPLSYQKLVDQPPSVALRQALEDANDKIHRRGAENADFHGMGTTGSALVLSPEGALVGHVGDSRVYRQRGRVIEQLSFDHSLVWEMTAGGQIRNPDLPIFIPKNIITRSLGPNPQVQVDLEGPFAVEAGDTFLLCSDGLSGQVADAEIGTVLQCLSPAAACQLLVDLANLRGGPDNITVVVARASRGFGQQTLETNTNHTTVESSRQPLAITITVLQSMAAGGLALLGALAAVKAMYLQALLCWGLAGLLVTQAWMRRRPAPATTADAPAVIPSRAGRAPYVVAECQPHPQFADQLSRMAQQLQEAASDESWSIDWEKFHVFRRQAEADVARRDFASAICNYAGAISFMMGELRSQRQKRDRTDDHGAVDL